LHKGQHLNPNDLVNFCFVDNANLLVRGNDCQIVDSSVIQDADNPRNRPFVAVLSVHRAKQLVVLLNCDAGRSLLNDQALDALRKHAIRTHEEEVLGVVQIHFIS
jgi:hypothetical protein